MGLFSKAKSALSGLGKSSSTSSSSPWAPQQQYLKDGFSEAQSWYNQNKGPNQNIQAGWQGQLDAAQSGLGGAVPTSQNLNAFFSDPGMLDPNSNQFLAQNINQLGEAITRQTGRNQNQINQQAAQAGAFGGGRQGVAQGLNAEAATNAFAEGSANMLLDNYNKRMSQMQAQQQFLPQVAQMSTMPAMLQESIGRSEQDLQMENLQKYWGIVGSNQWGGTTTGTQQASPLQMFGQFATGASKLGGMMGGGGAGG